MRRSLHFLITKLFLFFLVPSYACMCTDFRTIEENTRLYPFIAHVRITDKIENNDTTKNGDKMIIHFSYRATLIINILELFKGDPLKSITEHDIHTSCEIGIYAGEEWVIFARYDSASGAYAIGGCFPGRRIRNRKGERNWDWDMTYMITALQKNFKHPVTEEQYDSGVYKSFYANGNLEWEAGYRDHKLNGNRKVYYSNGKICLDQNFVNNKYHGSSNYYNNAGQLIKEGTYENGRCLHCMVWNDYTTDPLSGHFIKTPEYKGKPAATWLRRESYSLDSLVNFDCDYYKSGVLEREAYYNHRDSFCVIINYRKPGSIYYRSTIYWKEKKRLHQQWNENGKLEMDRVYVDDKLVESKPVQ